MSCVSKYRIHLLWWMLVSPFPHTRCSIDTSACLGLAAAPYSTLRLCSVMWLQRYNSSTILKDYCFGMIGDHLCHKWTQLVSLAKCYPRACVSYRCVLNLGLLEDRKVLVNVRQMYSFCDENKNTYRLSCALCFIIIGWRYCAVQCVHPSTAVDR
jgi:hypothetical protein